MSYLHRLVAASSLGIAVLALGACDDPAKDKAKAVATEAKEGAITATSSTAKRYDFDQTSSRIEWTGSKVTGKHEGGFKSFRGHISVLDQKPDASSVIVDIEAGSLFTDNDRLVAHLKSADFFDAEHFPKVSFTSTSIRAGGEKGASHTVTGNLTLHGVTKSITFPATIKTTDGSVDADAEFAINRKEFGLAYTGKADDLIRDDVVIKLTIRSRKQS
jgi:polyisoprenoid-binding protein YceI